MPRIPQFRSRRLPSTNVGAAPLPLDAAQTGGGQIGHGMADLGRGASNLGVKLAQIQERKDALVDSQSTIEARRIRERGEMEQRLFEQKNPHSAWTENATMIAKRDAEEISTLQGTDEWRSKELLNNKFNIETSSLRAETRATVQLSKESVALAQDDYTSTISKYGPDSEQANQSLATARTAFTAAGISADLQEAMFKDMTATGARVYHESQVESIRALAYGAVTPDGNKDAVYTIINKAQKEGLISADENGTLGNQIDSFTSGRFDQAKQKEKQTVHQEYRSLTDKINAGALDASNPNALTFQDVFDSKMSNADKELWVGFEDDKGEFHEGYIQGMYKDPPTETTYDGYLIAGDAVRDVSNLRISPTQGYDKLLKSRFVDFTITQKDFDWAVEKIENPYPKHIADPLYKTIGENRAKSPLYFDDFSFFGDTKPSDRDKKREQEVNTSLTNWVDSEIKEGRTPNALDIEKQSSYFNYGQRSLVELGQVINRGELE